jgi:hypothetical protein
MELLQIKKSKGCNVCGGKLVFIRGKYPKTAKRKVCPTCAVERLEAIYYISSPDYGKISQNIQPTQQ